MRKCGITKKCTGVADRAEFEVNVAGGNPVILDVELNRFAWTESFGVGWLSGWCRGLFVTTFQVVRACQVVLNLQVVRARTIIRAGQVALIGQVVRAVMLC
jgi:hypothetical protein